MEKHGLEPPPGTRRAAETEPLRPWCPTRTQRQDVLLHPRRQLAGAAEVIRLAYSEKMNARTSACCEAESALKKLPRAVDAWPWWRLIASVTVTLAPSCMNRVRAPMPHSGAVRTWSRV